MLSRWLLDPSEPRADAVVEGSVAGGTVGFLIVLGAALLGASTLPDWTFVPSVVIAVQVGFSQVINVILTQDAGSADRSPSGPTYEQLAFTLFGVITMPGLVLFIVIMTLVSVL